MRALGGVAVMVALLAAPASAAVTLTSGERRVTIDPRVDVVLFERKDAAPVLSWKASGEGAVGRATTGAVDVVLAVTPDAEGATLRIELRYGVAAEVEREAVTVELPGDGSAVARDLTFGKIGPGGVRIDRGTPLVVCASDLLVTAIDGVIAAEARATGERTTLTLFLDDERAHPFEPFAACRATTEEKPAKRIWRSRLARRKGDVVTATVRLQLGGGFTPLVVERWAAGARGAFVVTDHADRTDLLGLRAVMYGTSDVKAASYGKSGFLGHGLRLTRTFFGRRGKGTLTDPEAQALADELVAAGSEVGLHSITAKRDRRSYVKKHLGSYGRWKAETWIDHQPTTNCEALASQGARDGRHDIRDLLVKRGYRWVWSGRDVSGPPVLHDLFAAAPMEPAPTVFPLPSEPRLWVFRSSWFYDRPEKLAAALDDAALDRLERGRGLFVGHVYLSPTLRNTRRSDLRKRVLVDVKKGVATLDRRFDAALGRVGARVKAGRLASLTVAEAGDRVVALGDVVVSYRADGAAVVENRGARPVKALTVAVPVGGAELLVDGETLTDARAEDGRTLAWFDLAARGSAVVTARVKGAPLPFLRGGGALEVGVTR